MSKYCLKCMELMNANGVCPKGCDQNPWVIEPHRIRPGKVLRNKYLIGRHIGQGGFGITYIARDLSLDRIVAIKEYYPTNCVNRNTEVSSKITVYNPNNRSLFESGKKKFLEEAKTLAKFSGHSGMVGIIEYFEENDTAYIVMEYLNGITLKNYLIKNQKISSKSLFKMMRPVVDILEKVHEERMIHRDISPDNIMLMGNGTLKLLDFGAARQMNYQDDKTASVIVKRGYAPIEQYLAKGLGPWTDIYALCATIYHCITGIAPKTSLERLQGGKIDWPSDLGIHISKTQESVLKKGLELQPQDRYQSIREIKELLYGIEEEEFWDISTKPLEDNNSEDKKRNDQKGDGDTVCIFGDESPTEIAPKKPKSEELSKLEELSKSEEPSKPEELSKSEEFLNPEEPMKPQLKSEKKENRLIKVVLLVVLLIAVAFGAITVYNQNTRGIVPDMTGVTKDKAEIMLEEGGLTLGKVDYEYSDDVEKGNIISQDIKAGTEIRNDETINLVISKGKLYTVPDVTGKTLKKAKTIFKNYNLKVEVEKEVWSDDVKKGDIISQNPKAGEQVEEGNIVYFIVSKGVEIVKVPDVEGKSLSKAKKSLENSKLKYEVQEEYHDTVADGDVISQSVVAGKKVEKNTKVNLKVSKGKEPAPVVKPTPKPAPTPEPEPDEHIDDWTSVN